MGKRTRESIRQATETARMALRLATTNGQTNPDHIGDLAWWDPSPGWRAPAADVAAAFAARGLDPATLPLPPDWSVAFGRAVTRVKATLTTRDATLIDAAEGPNGERRVGVLSIARNGIVTTAHDGTVTCPRDGAAAFVEVDDAAGIAREIVDAARALVDVYTSEDIRAAIVGTFDRYCAMPCRQSPPHVVYWIPPGAGNAVRALADAVEAVGWGRIELFAGYASDERSKRAVVSSVNAGIEAQLAAFAAAADKYASDPKTRRSTLEAQLSEAASLRQQGDLYREILGAAVASVDERIARVESTLRVALGLDAAPSEPAIVAA